MSANDPKSFYNHSQNDRVEPDEDVIVPALHPSPKALSNPNFLGSDLFRWKNKNDRSTDVSRTSSMLVIQWPPSHSGSSEAELTGDGEEGREREGQLVSDAEAGGRQREWGWERDRELRRVREREKRGIWM